MMNFNFDLIVNYHIRVKIVNIICSYSLVIPNFDIVLTVSIVSLFVADSASVCDECSVTAYCRKVLSLCVLLQIVIQLKFNSN